MDDAVPVQVDERAQRLRRAAPTCIASGRPRAASMIVRRVLLEVHGEVRIAVVVEAVVEHADDVGMAQRRQQAELVRERRAAPRGSGCRGVDVLGRIRFTVTTRPVRRSITRYTLPIPPRASWLMIW